MTGKKLKVAFFLPSNGVSGGVFVVYTHARALAAAGHDVSIVFWNFDETQGFSFFHDFEIHYFKVDEIPSGTLFDIVIATWWETLYRLPDIPAKKHFYFVQSDERRFYPESEVGTKRWVETTYSLREIGIVTEARWIKEMLEREFGLDVVYAPNGINNHLFNPDVAPLESKAKKFRVLIEGPGRIFFKRVADAFAITNAFNDIEVWYVSSDGYADPAWRYDRFFSAVPFSQMPSIYRSCDILVKVSSVEGFFGPPLEMMACGRTSIVSRVTGYDEYIVDGFNAVAIDIGDISAGQAALEKLKGDEKFRERLELNALATAKSLDWSNQLPKFEKALFDLSDLKEDTPLRTLTLIRNLWKFRLQAVHFEQAERLPAPLKKLIKQRIRDKFPIFFRALILSKRALGICNFPVRMVKQFVG